MFFRFLEHVRAKEVISVGVGQVAQFFGGLMLLSVLTNALTPSEFGTFTVLLTITALSQTVILGGVQGAVSRYYSVSKSEGDLPAFLGSIVVIGLLLATFILAFGLITSVVFGRIARPEMSSAVIAITVLSMLMVFSGLINAVDTGARRQGLVSLHTAGALWLRAAAILIVFPVTSLGHTGALWSVIVASFAVLLSQMFFAGKNESYVFNIAKFRRWSCLICVFAVPYMSWGVMTWGQQVADRWLLNFFAGSEAVGEYTALFQLSYSPVLLLSAAVQRLATPIIYDVIGDALDAGKVKLATRIQVAMIGAVFSVGLVLCGLTLLGHKQITGLVLAAEYQSRSHLLPIFILAATLMSCYHLAGAVVPAIFQAKKMVLPLLVMSVISIAFMAVGAYIGGVDGMALSLLLSGFLFFVSVSLIARRLVARHLQLSTDVGSK